MFALGWVEAGSPRQEKDLVAENYKENVKTLLGTQEEG